MVQAMEGLVSRLEAAVSRLEALEARLGAGALSAGRAPIASPAAAEGAPGLKETSPNRELDLAGTPSVAAFEELIASGVARVLAAAEKVGGQILEASKLIKEAFEEEGKVVRAIAQCKHPDMEDLQKLVQPLALVLMKANSLTEGRRTDAFNHMKVVAESLQALSWVVYTKESAMSKPISQVEESWQSAEFYNNKVLIEYRSKDPNQAEWAKAVKELYLPGLRDYVKKFHATGPAWKPSGIEVKQFLDGTTAASSRAPRAPPPPPPPLAPPLAPPSGGPAPAGAAGPSKPSMSAVFNDINKGGAVTSGLKKVTDDMKTKNRIEKLGVVPKVEKELNDPDRQPTTKTAPPVFELQMDRKWVVENQTNNKQISITNCNSRQSVYIFGCKGSVIQVQGKVNNITFDKCAKTGLVFKDVVAACEIVNCTSVEVQCQGTAPTIAVDNTNGCQLYLSKESLKACITTAKSSEINVLVPGTTSDADYVEHALPEQFMNVYQDGRFVTTPVAHSGG